MANENVRSSILDAVNRVVARSGLAGTTIEAVAVEAGVSKGGVLYYFPNKNELLLGMIDRYESDFLVRRAEVLARLPDTPYRLLKAMVMVMLADVEATRDEIPNFATVLDDPVVCKRVGEFKRRMFKETTASLPKPEQAAAVMYIVDGIWMDVRFNPMVISKAHRKTLIQELMKYIESLG